MMHERGCVVSFNSDSPDHARRLNLEAAKAVKYGSLSEEDALKFVTLNPAIQLGIDSKVGSLKIGKDADFAIWTTSPLDYRAVCDQTWIDGKLYHDIRHARKRDQQRKEERETCWQKPKSNLENQIIRKQRNQLNRSFSDYPLRLHAICILIPADHMTA